MRSFSFVVLVASMMLPIDSSAGQAPPGKRLTVDIDVVASGMRGDTTRVTYVLANRATSVEQLFQFTIDAPSPVTWLPTPAPDSEWTTDRKSKGRSIAGWTVLGDQVAPGQASVQLSFEAVGLPGLVSAWVRGYVPPDLPPAALPDSVIDTLPPRPIPDILDLSLVSTAVGVSPLPQGITNVALASRLDSLTTRACNDLGWIASTTSCATLDGHLSAASTALAGANNSAARTALENYLAALDSGYTPTGATTIINGSAYWLLRPNATFLLARIP